MQYLLLKNHCWWKILHCTVGFWYSPSSAMRKDVKILDLVLTTKGQVFWGFFLDMISFEGQLLPFRTTCIILWCLNYPNRISFPFCVNGLLLIKMLISPGHLCLISSGNLFLSFELLNIEFCPVWRREQVQGDKVQKTQRHGFLGVRAQVPGGRIRVSKEEKWTITNRHIALIENFVVACPWHRDSAFLDWQDYFSGYAHLLVI